MDLRRLVTVGLLAVVGGLLSACGGSGGSPLAAGAFSPGGASAATLPAALESVGDTPVSRAYFEWGDLSEIRRLAARDGKVWDGVDGIGASALALPIDLQRLAGVTVREASTGVTVGDGADVAVRLRGPGVDPEAVTAALIRRGARRQGRFLALGAEGSGTSDVARAYGLLDRSIVGAHTVAMGRTDRAVLAVAGGATPLSDDPVFAAAGACLGNALWAVVFPVARLGGGPPGELLALGGIAPDAAAPDPARAPPVEEVCLVDRSASLTAAQAVRLRRTLGPASPFPDVSLPFGPRTVAIRRYVSSSHVERLTTDGVYADQATLTTPRNAGFLVETLEEDVIGELFARSCNAKLIDFSLPLVRLAALCRAIGLEPPAGS